jgi:hypothetical protein
LAADPIRGGIIPPEPEPELASAVLYSLQARLLYLVSSDFELDDFAESPVPTDLQLVDLDELTQITSDSILIARLCASDPVCNGSLLSAGPGWPQELDDVLLDAYGSSPTYGSPPENQPIPEPGTALLLALGLGSLTIASRNRSQLG